MLRATVVVVLALTPAAAAYGRPLVPMHRSVASWYDDAGRHCCGHYAYYGVADCGAADPTCYPQGTRIRFCLRRCVTATVDDHGPYVWPRRWDLNQNTARAIGFACGVCVVRWRLPVLYGRLR